MPGLPRFRRRCRDQLQDRGFREIGKEFTNGRGVDAIFDMVGGDYIPRELDLLAREGRLCFVALMGGTKIEADFGTIQRKHLTVTGSTLRWRSIEQKAQIVSALKDKVWPLWDQGKLRTCTYKTFPLAEAEGACADGISRISERSSSCHDAIAKAKEFHVKKT